MRILITGVSGFTGSHLADLFLGSGKHEIFGTIKWRSNRENIRHIEEKISLVDCDIRDAFAMKTVLLACAAGNAAYEHHRRAESLRMRAGIEDGTDDSHSRVERGIRSGLS